MGHPVAGRSSGPYPANMPIMEAFMTLAFVAAATSTIGLGTEVLVLPQRHPTLVAKQVSTLDTLSAGRVRLGGGGGLAGIGVRLAGDGVPPTRPDDG